MKFSILIAHYNNWEYFQECYKSIISQTYQNFEIVIVDDFSTDDSFEKLSDLAQKDSKIKLFQNTENKKVGFTKKRCVEVATGDVCGFLDPDDYLSPNAISEVVSTYKTYDKCIATYSKIKLVNQTNYIVGDFKHTKKILNGKKYFFNLFFEVAHFFTFKRYEYLKTTGINDCLIIAEDQDLYLKLYELGDFVFIDEFLYYYRLHDKGISQNKTKSNRQRSDWHQVILDTCHRRGIKTLYGMDVTSINDLPAFLFQKENTLFRKLKRKLGW